MNTQDPLYIYLLHEKLLPSKKLDIKRIEPKRPTFKIQKVGILGPEFSYKVVYSYEGEDMPEAWADWF
jgi:hypothetical protein